MLLIKDKENIKVDISFNFLSKNVLKFPFKCMYTQKSYYLNFVTLKVVNATLF